MKAKEYTKQGTEHLKKEEYDLAMENYLKASDLGDYYAMYNIACMYYFGDGVEKMIQEPYNGMKKQEMQEIRKETIAQPSCMKWDWA